MKNKLIYISLFIICYFSASCVKYIEKTSEVMSQNVYAIDSCRNTGRYDLLDGYTDNLIKLVPPPKQKIIIGDFNSDGFKTQYLKP